MNKEIVILGSGGHTRSLIVILESYGFLIKGIYDNSFDIKNKEFINGYELVGKIDAIKEEYNLVLSIGDNVQREIYFEKYYKQIAKDNLIHPKALIEKRVDIGCSNQFFANIYINSNVIIGNNNIINTSCIIEHEAIIGNHNHISIGAVLCGRVNIGSCCFIGAGAVVIDKVKICDNVIVGANSVVIKNITEPGTYVGNPVRRVK
ncbi:MAG: NeuD/PglB/VioB family sugar acetyltransferase [Bacteroidales bacterium]|jgi:sugar O-acyltransferase (sialic acid O-acetyltransferase NeuD family)